MSNTFPCPRCGVATRTDSTHCDQCGQPQPSRDDPPEAWIGRELDGKYRIEQILGVGGMGMVFRATRTLIGDQVALKILFPRFLASPLQRRLFEDEAIAAARLDHPNVVTVYDAELSSQDGHAYIAMELLEGHSLRSYLKAYAPIPPVELFPMAMQICDGLAAAHAAHIVHRDLKPDNIFLEQHRSGAVRVKLVDFGIAAMLDAEERTEEHEKLLGTLRYMAPEQCQQQPVDGRTDLYALGVILYEALTRRRATGRTVSAVLTEQVDPPNVHLPQARHLPFFVEDLVMRLLSKDPGGRPPTALALKAELEGCLDRLASGPAPGPLDLERGVEPSPPPAKAEQAQTTRGIVLVLAALAVLSLLGGYLLGMLE